jgi:hypothetical protein
VKKGKVGRRTREPLRHFLSSKNYAQFFTLAGWTRLTVQRPALGVAEHQKRAWQDDILVRCDIN